MGGYTDLKNIYKENQLKLQNLKIEITNSQSIDQGERSKLRIQIETLLIDINEELFSISEEQAKMFNGT